MHIIISNTSKDPIYEQIYVQIKKHILTNELQAGEALPVTQQFCFYFVLFLLFVVKKKKKKKISSVLVLLKKGV